MSDRYDKDRLIVNSHLDAILQLQPLNSESASQLLVSLEENLMATEAPKYNTKDFIWVRIISEKLDQEYRRQWELDYPGKKLQTLQQLRDFINKRVQALETSTSVISRKANQSTINEFGNRIFDSTISQKYKTTTKTCPCCWITTKFLIAKNRIFE